VCVWWVVCVCVCVWCVCVCVCVCVGLCVCVCVCFEDGLENVESRHKRRFSSFMWSMKKAAVFMRSRELTRE